mmetsp:Transcript_5611/g.9759  ORF Transcript_5611/g.9759 Transcript_5611/m.9759 type:complete len:289 (+) Transcript_5611:61-927(+)
MTASISYGTGFSTDAVVTRNLLLAQSRNRWEQVRAADLEVTRTSLFHRERLHHKGIETSLGFLEHVSMVGGALFWKGGHFAFWSELRLQTFGVEHIKPHGLHVVSFNGVYALGQLTEEVLVVFQRTEKDAVTRNCKATSVREAERERVIPLVVAGNILVVKLDRRQERLSLGQLLLDKRVIRFSPPHAPSQLRIGGTDLTLGIWDFEHHFEAVRMSDLRVAGSYGLHHVPVLSFRESINVILPTHPRAHVSALVVVGTEAKTGGGSLCEDRPFGKSVVVLNNMIKKSV